MCILKRSHRQGSQLNNFNTSFVPFSTQEGSLTTPNPKQLRLNLAVWLRVVTYDIGDNPAVFLDQCAHYPS